jgi:uncharacterized protein (TIGR02453 family)
LIPETLPFTGFDKEIFKFLVDLKKNNRAEWFRNNKERYQKYLVEPAKAFIIELTPFLNRLNPGIRTEPKFNETIMRLNKDMRFVKGEPYRPFLLIHFGRFKLDSEFYLYFSPDGAEIGLFINNTKGDNLFFNKNSEKFEKEIKEICVKYSINGNYRLSDLDNNMKIISAMFNAEKDFRKMTALDYILLDKKKIPEKILYTNKIVGKMVNVILQLYPLYCFAISPQPLKLIQKFKDDFGEIE